MFNYFISLYQIRSGGKCFINIDEHEDLKVPPSTFKVSGHQLAEKCSHLCTNA